MPALKHSRQRDAIRHFLMTRRDHPTADVVYSSVRNEFPNISLGTVYRNLTLLADIGEIARLKVGDGVDHFDYNTAPHSHFVCTKCGRVLDLDMKPLSEIDAWDGTDCGGHLIAGHVTYFYGTCSCCRQ